MSKNVLVIAHRGASDLLPDNSIPSFDQALAEKADMIELDVRKTADGYLVLYHDWYMRYNCEAYSDLGVSRMVSHARYSQLQRCCEQNGFELVTLDEVLARYGGRIAINIELKAGGYEQEVVNLVHRYGLSSSIVFSSFIPWVIMKLKDIDGSIKSGWIIGQEQVLKVNRLARVMLGWFFKKMKADSAHLHYEIVTPEVIGRFHSQNMPVYAWTVNDSKIMSDLIEIGVDGIITNKPGRLNSILNGDNLDNVSDIEFFTRLAKVGGP